MSERFSKRFGYSSSAASKLGKSVPQDFLYGLIQILKETKLRPERVRASVCSHLRRRQNFKNVRDQQIWEEIEGHLSVCEWFQVFDVIERLYADLAATIGTSLSEEFAVGLNGYLADNAVAWQLKDGRFEVRGGEIFQHAVETAIAKFDDTNRLRARTELHEALRDLARRPAPDLTGAVQHAMAALECVARDATGDQKATLGAILRRHPDLVPNPLSSALEKVWGYSSERGRHAREGDHLPPEEAELVVCMAAVVANYLVSKLTPN